MSPPKPPHLLSLKPLLPKKPTRISLLSLPPELLLLIANNLDLKSLHSLRSTNHHLALLFPPDYRLPQPPTGLPQLHAAVLRGNQQTVQYLLDFHPWPYANRRAPSHHDKTALYLAALKGDERIVRMLLDSGAAVNRREKTYGKTPLHMATVEGHEAIVKLLLQRGAKVAYRDYEGRTALVWAARSAPFGKELVGVFQMMVAQGADVNACDAEYGATVLHWAVLGGRRETVRWLLDNGAGGEVLDLRKESALDWAVKSGNAEMVKVFTERKGSEVSVVVDALGAQRKGDLGRWAKKLKFLSWSVTRWSRDV